MKTRFSWLTLAVAVVAVATFAFARVSRADEHEGEEMNVHNQTGHHVVVFLFQDANVHLNEQGGVQFGSLADGESAVAHVPHCTFSILLVDHEDVWHAEFHDCNSTDLTFHSDTGHAKKQ
jgi:hypothetical protein